MNRFFEDTSLTLTCSYSKTVDRKNMLPFQTAFIHSLQKHGERQCKFITNHVLSSLSPIWTGNVMMFIDVNV